MRYRRSRRIHSRRITEKERSAIEQAYLHSIQQQQYHQKAVQQAYLQSVRPQEQVRPFTTQHIPLKNKESPAPIGCYIPLLILVILIGFVFCSLPRSHTNIVEPAPTIEMSQPIDATASVCSTHSCIPNFPNGNGSLIECRDGTTSHAGGRRGACSHHGGEMYP